MTIRKHDHVRTLGTIDWRKYGELRIVLVIDLDYRRSYCAHGHGAFCIGHLHSSLFIERFQEQYRQDHPFLGILSSAHPEPIGSIPLETFCEVLGDSAHTSLT